MKTKLLRKVRKRYRIVFKDGVYRILDLKKKKINNLVSGSFRTISMYRLNVLKIIDLTIGEDTHTRLREKRAAKRLNHRKHKEFLLANI